VPKFPWQSEGAADTGTRHPEDWIAALTEGKSRKAKMPSGWIDLGLGGAVEAASVAAIYRSDAGQRAKLVVSPGRQWRSTVILHQGHLLPAASTVETLRRRLAGALMPSVVIGPPE